MEFSHLRGDNNRYYAEEEVDEDDRYERCPAGGNEVHHFLPLTSSASSSSSAIVHWIDGSEASPSSIPPAVPPKTAAAVEKEQMFEKVVTPSDVGKLNRLVIPKQHAEKYFPLDASTHDKGLLLNFEDRNGKPWRFRYSYWNSSQSYVMTKGWSRFVKEKRLAAGDIVSFGRGVGDNAGDRLFIDWKRRPDPLLHSPASFRIPRFPAYHYSPTSSSSPFPSSSSSSSYEPPTYHHPYISFSRSAAAPWAAGRIFVPNAAPPTAANYFCLRSTAIATPPQPLPDSPACLPDPMVLDSVPVAHSKAPTVTKRVRLFGVNLEQQHELETADNSNATGLLRIQSRSPLSSPEPRLSGVESSPAASSSSSSIQGAKECQH